MQKWHILQTHSSFIHLTYILYCFVSVTSFHTVFQWLLCFLCVLCPAVACVKSVEMFQKLSCLSCVFSSVLACAKSAHMFQKLSYLLCGLCLSFLSLITSSDSKGFLRLIAFSGSLQQYTVLSFASSRCEGMPTVTN